MHELSIAQSIVDIADEEARKAGAVAISKIELDIGLLAGIEFDAFDFAWPEAVRNTFLENAERVINKIPGKAQCVSCGHIFEMKDYFELCPECGAYNHEIISGKELKIKSIEITKG